MLTALGKNKQNVQTKLKHFEQKKQKKKPIPRTASRNISSQSHTLHPETSALSLHPETSALTCCIQKHQLSHSVSKKISSLTLHPKTQLSHAASKNIISLCMIQKHHLSHSASRNTSLFCIQKHQFSHSALKNISSLCIQKHQLTLRPETSVLSLSILSLSIQKRQLSHSLMYRYHLCKALFVNPNEQKLKQDANLDYPDPHTTTVLRDET